MHSCGYADDLIRPGFRFGDDRTVELAAFAHEPVDARSACMAAITATEDVPQVVVACRELGSPIVFVVDPQGLQVWRQGTAEAQLVRHVAASKAAGFFRLHKEELSPEAVYRAKTWARFETGYQLHFVDAGLMPVVEKDMGERLKSLIERVVHRLSEDLRPESRRVPVAMGHWFIKTAFWLLAAKILRDKEVPKFRALDLLDVPEVVRRVAQHYDSAGWARSAIPIRTRKEHEALRKAASAIAEFSHLGHVTTESLAYVYESALITKDTRAALGTHSTPPYLVDYLVWKLAPWIEEIPPDQRVVYEPACGHAAFLVAAMRLLKGFPPVSRLTEQSRYLRDRLHGVDVDSFALEIARLSLTLADIPNPDGWDLRCENMYEGSGLEKKAQEATVVLANPPFGNFSMQEKREYARKGVHLRYMNKAAEVLGRVLPALRPGAVFGFVVPQGLLHSKNAESLRKLMAEDFEIREICLFPDRMFAFSAAESAVILGRRAARRKRGVLISYRRVREPDVERFKLDYAVTTKRQVPQDSLCAEKHCNMRLPDLHEVWAALRTCPALSDIAELGKGLDFRGRGLPHGTATIVSGGTKGAPGFARFDVRFTHQRPTEYRLNLDPDVISARRTGAQVGRPQVLLNYARVSRGPWRLRAVMDRQGHAVTSRFITVRPKSAETPLEYLWGLLNCPLANAYAYANLMKRDILVGMMRAMPVPAASVADMEHVAGVARRYLELVTSSRGALSVPTDEDSARRLLMELDAEILRLCDLAPGLERQLLDLFAGPQRAGVPFRFDRYFPSDFEPWVYLHEYLSEDYRRSTAGALRAAHKDVTSEGLLEVLRRASEEFQE